MLLFLDMLELMTSNSSFDADQIDIESTYFGLGFLVDLIGLEEFGMLSILGQSALSYISSVMRGPFSR